jgi:hypothetical protein
MPVLVMPVRRGCAGEWENVKQKGTGNYFPSSLPAGALSAMWSGAKSHITGNPYLSAPDSAAF